MLAGGFGHTYRHERVFGFGKDGAAWREHLDAAGAKCMGHMVKLMNAHGSLGGALPAPELVAGAPGKAGRGESDLLVAATLAERRAGIVYSANGRGISLRMDQLAEGEMFGMWFNPRNGLWHVRGEEGAEMRPFSTGIASGRGMGVREFDPPGEPGPGNDWVLMLGRVE